MTQQQPNQSMTQALEDAAAKQRERVQQLRQQATDDAAAIQTKIDGAGGDLQELAHLERSLKNQLAAVGHAKHQLSLELQSQPRGTILQQGRRRVFVPAEREGSVMSQEATPDAPPAELTRGQQAQGSYTTGSSQNLPGVQQAAAPGQPGQLTPQQQARLQAQQRAQARR